uniref:G-protein coupled receptors family 2 profile 1 domain-containing protein n=1 Tax=Oreochromis aureus TaxID=47969 RepID=A0A668S742_OREAU
MAWDGWLCWDETKAGVKERNCPDYYDCFDIDGKFLCDFTSILCHSCLLRT